MANKAFDLPAQTNTGVCHELIFDTGYWVLFDFDYGKIYQFAQIVLHFCGMSYRVSESAFQGVLNGFCIETWTECLIQNIGLQGCIRIYPFEKREGEITGDQKKKALHDLKMGCHVGFFCLDEMQNSNSIFHIQAPFAKKRWTRFAEDKQFYCDGVETNLQVSSKNSSTPLSFPLCIIGSAYKEAMLYQEFDDV